MEKSKFDLPKEARMAVRALVGNALGGFDRPVTGEAEMAVDGGILLDLAELEGDAGARDRRMPARLDVRWPREWSAGCGEGPSDLVATPGGRFFAVSPSGSMRTGEVDAAAVRALLDRRGAVARAWGRAAAGGWPVRTVEHGPVCVSVDVPYPPTHRQGRLAIEASEGVFQAFQRDPRLGPAEAEAAANAALGSAPWRALAFPLGSGVTAVVLVEWVWKRRREK